MKSFLIGLSSFYQKHNAILKALSTLLPLLGATNYIPLSWWRSPLLSWQISSQTTLTIIIVLLSYIVFVSVKNRELKHEVESLVLRNKINSLTPEEQADLTKEKLVYAARFYSQLLGLNKPSKNINETNKTP